MKYRLKTDHGITCEAIRFTLQGEASVAYAIEGDVLGGRSLDMAQHFDERWERVSKSAETPLPDLGRLFHLMLLHVSWSTCKMQDHIMNYFPDEVRENLEAKAAEYKAAGGSWEEYT